MRDHEISLAEMFRVTNYLPMGWSLVLDMTGAEAGFSLCDPEGFDVEVFPDGDDADDHILDHVNEARKAEGMKLIDWDGEEQDA